MSDYTIVGFKDNNITLSYDGIVRNFPLPISDGLYPTGDALTSLLDIYVQNDRLVSNVIPIVGTNVDEITSLIQPSNDIIMQRVRASRNSALIKTDFTQLDDYPSELKSLWIEYRTQLRNLTNQPGFPTSVVWPVPPEQITTVSGIHYFNADNSPITFK